MKDVYVLGGAQTDFERNWNKEGKNVLALLKEVVDDAFKKTKIKEKEIVELNKANKVAIFIGNFAAEYYVNQGHLGPLMTEVNKCFYGVPSARYEAACASSSVALDAAITKIKSNEYDLAIVIGWELMKTVDSKTGGDYLGRAALYEVEAKEIDFPFPKLFGKLADAVATPLIFLSAIINICTISPINKYVIINITPFIKEHEKYANQIAFLSKHVSHLFLGIGLI